MTLSRYEKVTTSWISVKKRLPLGGNYPYVLCLHMRGGAFCYDVMSVEHVVKTYMLRNSEKYNPNHIMAFTHWMPIWNPL